MGPEEFRKKMRERKLAVHREINKALAEAGVLVSGEAKRLVMRSPRGGRVYQKYDPVRIHKSSAPGEPAATDTGMLASSISYETLPDEFVVIIRCASGIAPYARVMEYGTANGKIKPRPFMRPAIRSMGPKARSRIKRGVNIALKAEAP